MLLTNYFYSATVTLTKSKCFEQNNIIRRNYYRELSVGARQCMILMIILCEQYTEFLIGH